MYNSIFPVCLQMFGGAPYLYIYLQLKKKKVVKLGIRSPLFYHFFVSYIVGGCTTSVHGMKKFTQEFLGVPMENGVMVDQMEGKYT